MSYKIYSPCEALQDVVRYFWSAEIDCISGSFEMKTYVDDSTGIIFHHSKGRNVLRKPDLHLPKAIIYGQVTSPTSSFSNSSFCVVGVLFYPHVFHALWKFNASDFKDNIQPLEDVLKVGSLTDQIVNIENVDDQIQVISQFLLYYVKKSEVERPWVNDAVCYIKSQHGLLSVGDVRDYFKISERKLERDFKAVIGVSPMHYIQVTRFGKILRELKKEDMKNLTNLALDHNYADQSHFNKTFRKFSGFSPRELKGVLKEEIVNLIV